MLRFWTFLFAPAWMAKKANDNSTIDKILRSVEKAKSQNELAEIAKRAPLSYAYSHAVLLLTDQAILEDLALNHARVSEQAIGKLTNNELLVDLALKGSVAAIRRIIDQNVLISIAKNGDNYQIRSAAIKRMFSIQATSSSQQHSNFSEIKNISDRTILEDIAKNSESKHEKRESEIRLYILAGVRKQCEKHVWVPLDCCLKKCASCGALKYDHKYRGFNFSDNGFVSSVDFQCEKCGHSAKRHEGFMEEQDYDTRESGLV